MSINARGSMGDVIVLSSDSEEEDSDVEIMGSYKHFMTKGDPDPLPLSEVRVDVDALKVNVPTQYINLTDPKWSLPDLKLRKRKSSAPLAVMDLTEKSTANVKKADNFKMIEKGTTKKTLNEQDCNLKRSTLSGPTAPEQDQLNSEEKQRYQEQHRTQTAHENLSVPTVKINRLPFLETHVTEIKTSCSVFLTKDCMPMSLNIRQPRRVGETSQCTEMLIPSLSSPISSDDKAHSSNPGPQISEAADNVQSCLSDHSSHFPATGLSPSEPANLHSQPQTSLKSQDHTRQVEPVPASKHTPSADTSEWQTKEFKDDEASNGSDILHWNIPVTKSEDFHGGSESGQYGGYVVNDSPLSFLWQEGIDEEQAESETRLDMDFRAASLEDRRFVCPVTFRKIMSGLTVSMTDEVEEGSGSPRVLCRQSLSLVYSTIDENYPEGTLQLLSDLLKPGYYPPKDITVHLLHDILLNQQCPYHLCVQAFNLLMRTQRHHMADKTTVPWDWESLSTLMANQDLTKKHRTEVVRMLLEYVVQTLEDDFQVKYSSSTLHLSIAKVTLSCDQKFPYVRDVIKWLISAIMKSTEHGQRRELARERNEHVRVVSILQRMLSLAVEVDRSPALTSAKLSQELFHMLIGNVPLRAHSLLLHFLMTCTLEPDPMDGTERWKKWEELVHLLWMLLLSYNQAMKGFLCSSVGEQNCKVGTLVYKQDDKVSKAAVREAVAAFHSRSYADLGQALPLHVDESLGYLQDYLLDVCQC
ncbi:SUMO-interacting motif-containing protein 1 isoform X2 [Notolabrus celidotus]|uniref:SUMO-interacting motif-containing protein 1 isoform X2 n=2 Tax=Notolabrus celidotus TaxID=1203425 RepID=UPI00149076A5|nr:SUMO-interacting motif-containing protein 1 isoform X2 [Notolabrus celidotus]